MSGLCQICRRLAPSAFFYTGQFHGFLFIYCQTLGYPQPSGLRDETERHLPQVDQGAKSPGISCFTFSHIPIFSSSLLSIMFIMAQLTYAMAEDGLLFPETCLIPAPTDARTIMIRTTNARIIVRTAFPQEPPSWLFWFLELLQVNKQNSPSLKSYFLTCIFPVVSHLIPLSCSSSQPSWLPFLRLH